MLDILYTDTLVPRERLHDLLCCPPRRWLLLDVEVDDTAMMVCKHAEDEEDPEGDGGHGEEIDGYQFLRNSRPLRSNNSFCSISAWKCCPYCSIFS